jgi:hypothetical protein
MAGAIDDSMDVVLSSDPSSWPRVGPMSLVSFQGILTAVEATFWELDYKYRVFTAHASMDDFGNGLRPGAVVCLRNVHVIHRGSQIVRLSTLVVLYSFATT